MAFIANYGAPICIVALLVVAFVLWFSQRASSQPRDEEFSSSPTHAKVIRYPEMCICNTCKTKFASASGKEPTYCPGCGDPVVGSAGLFCGGEDEEYAKPYICSTCGAIASVDGEDLRCCPICGQEHLDEGVFINRIQAYWTCDECDQEFRLPPSLLPTRCPVCRAVLTMNESFDWGEKKCRKCKNITRLT